jgi:hypothetical protein
MKHNPMFRTPNPIAIPNIIGFPVKVPIIRVPIDRVNEATRICLMGMTR